jgi:hypothetical protein
MKVLSQTGNLSIANGDEPRGTAAAQVGLRGDDNKR